MKIIEFFLLQIDPFVLKIEMSQTWSSQSPDEEKWKCKVCFAKLKNLERLSETEDVEIMVKVFTKIMKKTKQDLQGKQKN